MNKHMRRGYEDGGLGFLVALGCIILVAVWVGSEAREYGYEEGVKDAALGKAVVRTLPDGTVKVYKASELKEAK